MNSDRRTIGFVGLGSMGGVMARRLLDAGFGVLAYNRTRAKARPLAEAGATVVDSPAEAAACGLVVTMVANDEALDAVVHGDDGILAGLPDGGLHVSMSTVGTALVTSLAAEHANAGRRYLAAPVLGRPDAAAAGKLFVIAAGDERDVERARPAFEAMAQRVFRVADLHESANLVKLSANFLITCVMESLGEVLALCGKHGLDRGAVLDVLTSTIFGAPVYRTYGTMIATDRFTPVGFALPLGLKDNRLLLEAAAASEVPLPFASVVRDQLLTALASGYGELDWAALGRVAADRANAGGTVAK